MNATRATRAIAILAGLACFTPLAVAQDFQRLSVVRLDPESVPLAERRRQSAQIEGGGGLKYQQERAELKNGAVVWSVNVDGTGAVSRKQMEALRPKVQRAVAAHPAGNVSGSTTPAGKRRYEIAIDGTRFEVLEGCYASPALEEALSPLVLTLDALIEAKLPPPAFYQKIIYRRGGHTLEISPTGTMSVQSAGGQFTFGNLTQGPLKRLDVLAAEAGIFVETNSGRAIALPTGSAGGEPFELELTPLRGGAPFKVTGRVGSYAESAKPAGALVDYLDGTLRRKVAASAPAGGFSSAVDPQ